MRLLKSLLLGTIASTVLGQDAPVCPEGWAIGANKCYKENISKFADFPGKWRGKNLYLGSKMYIFERKSDISG